MRYWCFVLTLFLAYSQLLENSFAQPFVRWNYQNTGGSAQWESRSVSVGNRGTLAWAGLGTNAERVALFATTEDQSPPQFVYEIPMSLDNVRVAAAENSPRALVTEAETGNPNFYYLSAFSSTPLLQGTASDGNCVSFLNCVNPAISDDGNRFAFAYRGFSSSGTRNTARIRYFDFAASTPPMFNLESQFLGFRDFEMSNDGNFGILLSDSAAEVYEFGTGTVVHVEMVSFGTHVAIDGTGDLFAVSSGKDVSVWKKAGGVYSQILTFSNFSQPVMTNILFTASAFSKDGSTFATAASDFNDPSRIAMVVFDLTGPAPVELWRYDNQQGSGTKFNSPREISMSHDGSIIGLSSLGAFTNTPPHVAIFDKSSGPTPIYSFTAPSGNEGSQSVSIDGRGHFAVHASAGPLFQSNVISVDLDREGPYKMFGTAAIGRTITLSSRGIPGDIFFLGFDNALGVPTPISGFSGLYYLTPQAVTETVGPYDAFGNASMSYSNFVDPSQVGQTVFTQGISAGSNNELQNYLEIPVLP